MKMEDLVQILPGYSLHYQHYDFEETKISTDKAVSEAFISSLL